MSSVISQDGTQIAFDEMGKGAAVILVASALATRDSASPLAERLAERLTVINYDRRGRGESGDTPPYAVAREIEDIAALVEHAGGSVFLFGSSSGAALALEAANRLGGKVKKQALFEPPFIVDGTRSPLPADYAARVGELAAAGQRGAAVEYFMSEAVGVPPEFIEPMKQSPMWADLQQVAHTLRYDGELMGDTMLGKPLSPTRWRAATARTLVLDGGASPAWLRNGAKMLAEVLPNAQYRTLEGQDHSLLMSAPDVLAGVLVEFFEST